ncbi:MAG: hypothetical protein LUF27_05085 [Lachnospiraceae bacterium]|nr:hypothetical protein [Lachnospiraceae bacterium]
MANIPKASKQICVYKTDKGLLEMNNKLLPAPNGTPWHIHAEGKEEGYSLIQMVALDYSRGKGEKSVSVYANVKPEDIKFLFMKLCFGFESVKYSEQKIFKDGDGGFVTSLQIERAEYNEKGDRMRLPWSVRIGNGSGTVAYNRNGGQYYERDSYDEKRVVKVHLDDRSFFRLLSRTCAVIDAFEQKQLYREKDVQNFQTLFNLICGRLEAYFGGGLKSGGLQNRQAISGYGGLSRKNGIGADNGTSEKKRISGYANQFQDDGDEDYGTAFYDDDHESDNERDYDGPFHEDGCDSDDMDVFEDAA